MGHFKKLCQKSSRTDMHSEAIGWKKVPFFSDGSQQFERLKDTRIAKASKQYVFDEEGTKYLDCFNGVAHVGHCHPQVVAAATTQMARVCTSQGFKSTLLQNYVKRLARQFTEEEDIVVTEDAFHGNLGILIDISPKMHGYV